jgi:glyoxylate reductase
MNPIRIFISRKLPLPPNLSKRFDVRVWPFDRSPTTEDLIEHARECEGLISMLCDDLSAPVLNQLGRLRAIAQYAVGVNNIDLEACKARGIEVSSTPGVLTRASANHALLLMLSVARQLSRGQSIARAGLWRGWEPEGLLGVQLDGATLGIIGMGRIARELGRKCHAAFGMKILYTRKRNTPLELGYPAELATLKDLLQRSDVISLHTPLTNETQNLLGQREISLMKDEAILINTSRGEVIDQEALVRALEAGKFQGVGLDVTTPEPLLPHHPLYSFERVLITPHIASAERQTREEMARVVYQAMAQLEHTTS